MTDVVKIKMFYYIFRYLFVITVFYLFIIHSLIFFPKVYIFWFLFKIYLNITHTQSLFFIIFIHLFLFIRIFFYIIIVHIFRGNHSFIWWLKTHHIIDLFVSFDECFFICFLFKVMCYIRENSKILYKKTKKYKIKYEKEKNQFRRTCTT